MMEIGWQGSWGDDYHGRRCPSSEDEDERNYRLWEKALLRVILPGQIRQEIESISEIGCGNGTNLRTLGRIFLGATLAGVEVNPGAVEVARAKTPGANIIEGDFLEVGCPFADLVVTRGVLIHVPPGRIESAYGLLHWASKRWIAVVEYFNPEPVQIKRYGLGKMPGGPCLWKRDFGGELLDRYPLELVDYGFVCRRDPFPQDDVTWWLLSKQSSSVSTTT